MHSLASATSTKGCETPPLRKKQSSSSAHLEQQLQQRKSNDGDNGARNDRLSRPAVHSRTVPEEQSRLVHRQIRGNLILKSMEERGRDRAERREDNRTHLVGERLAVSRHARTELQLLGAPQSLVASSSTSYGWAMVVRSSVRAALQTRMPDFQAPLHAVWQDFRGKPRSRPPTRPPR